MLTFLVLCILIIMAFPLIIWLAVVGFWAVVALIMLIAAIWAGYWVIEGMEYASTVVDVTTPIVGSFNLSHIGGLVLWVACIAAIFIVILVPNMAKKGKK